MKRLSELSQEELLKSKARITGVLIVYAVLIIMLIGAYLYIRFGMSRSISLIPFSVLPIMCIPIAVSLKNITHEIKERQGCEKNNHFDK